MRELENRLPHAPTVSLLSLAVVVALSGFMGEATATPITVNSDIAAGTSVVDSGSQSGHFDISAYLAGSSVVSGSVTATFSQAQGQNGYVHTGETHSGYSQTGSHTYYHHSNSYCCGWDTCYHSVYYTDYFYRQDNTHAYFSEASTAVLNVGASSLDAAASTYFNTGALFQSVSHSEAWHGSGYRRYSDYYYNVHERNYGIFSATLSLDSVALDAINASGGLLDFTISSVSGGFQISGVTLSADVQANTPAPALPPSVPEPELLALLGLGLASLALARRRGKRIPRR